METKDTNRKPDECFHYDEGNCKAMIPTGPCPGRPTCTYWKWGGGPKFPVMDKDGPLQEIPLSIVAPHERQARANHGQTLKRLAERGGLCPIELVAVLEDKPFPMDIGVNDDPGVLKERERCRAYLVNLMKNGGRVK